MNAGWDEFIHRLLVTGPIGKTLDNSRDQAMAQMSEDCGHLCICANNITQMQIM